jgi:hypothetical protein
MEPEVLLPLWGDSIDRFLRGDERRLEQFGPLVSLYEADRKVNGGLRSIIYIVIGIILAVFGLSTFAAGVAQGAFGGFSTSSNPYSYVVADVVIGGACLVLGVVLIAYGARRRRAENAHPSNPPK